MDIGEETDGIVVIKLDDDNSHDLEQNESASTPTANDDNNQPWSYLHFDVADDDHHQNKPLRKKLKKTNEEVDYLEPCRNRRKTSFCNLCNFVCSRGQLRYHLENSHGISNAVTGIREVPSSVTRSMGDETTTTSTTPRDHQRPYQCEICGVGFRTRLELSKHMARKVRCSSNTPEDGIVVCEEYGEGFNDENGALSKHILSHGTEFSCRHCPTGFKRPRALTAHEKRFHANIKPVQCRICIPKRGYLHKRSLTMHEEAKHRKVKVNAEADVKTKEKVKEKTEIDSDDERFLDELELEGKKVNTVEVKEEKNDEDEAICENIQEDETTEATINDSVDIDVKMEVLVCGDGKDNQEQISKVMPDVDLNFDQPNLKFPINCTLCDFGCLSRRVLRQHLERKDSKCQLKRSANGFFTCSECGDGFIRESDFIHHAQSHSRDFPCPYCHVGYRVKASLRKHTKKVHPELLNPFPCLTCRNIRFKSKQRLAKHYRDEHHGVPIAETVKKCEIDSDDERFLDELEKEEGSSKSVQKNIQLFSENPVIKVEKCDQVESSHFHNSVDIKTEEKCSNEDSLFL